MAYTQEDIDSARSIARSKESLTKVGIANPPTLRAWIECYNEASVALRAWIKYYNETLAHLTGILEIGFDAYTKTPTYGWDIKNIPVLKTSTLTKENFEIIINDAINLYTYLISNP